MGRGDGGGDGMAVGYADGMPVGFADGMNVGCALGHAVGCAVGVALGTMVGVRLDLQTVRMCTRLGRHRSMVCPGNCPGMRPCSHPTCLTR